MTIRERLERLDWTALERSLRERGFATTPTILRPPECADLIRLYADESRFRKRIDMERHRFGVGEYKYFADPLPPLVRSLRVHAYRHLAPIANRWMAALGSDERFPPSLRGLLSRCRSGGQTKPTPLLLRYASGGYNCLHQDLYGPIVFPMQVTCLLSRNGDFSGGEFLLVETRPRAQSIGHAVRLEQGRLILFTTRARPAVGLRGTHRVGVRHGVSRILSGRRYSLGVIFHDAA